MKNDWVRAASALPLGFAQVREDPLIDGGLLRRLESRPRVLMIASGGCTAAYLAATCDIGELVLVDPNPAQIALTRLKLRLLAEDSPSSRMAILGHASMAPEDRAHELERRLDALGLDIDVVGPEALVVTRGPDHAGRYEALFAQLAAALQPQKAAVEELLAMRDPAKQALRVKPGSALGNLLESAFTEVMDLENLVGLFGEGATRNPKKPFAEHFLNQVRGLLGRQPAAGNPFLWQMLLGKFQADHEYAWLSQPSPLRMPKIVWRIEPMTRVLATIDAGFDLIHLSNILDWLSPLQARETLELAADIAKPGSWIVVRQLNSILDIPTLSERFLWDRELSNTLLDSDRSFFYRAVHVGRRV